MNEWVYYTYGNSLFKPFRTSPWLTKRMEKNTHWHLNTYAHYKTGMSNLFGFIQSKG